MTRLPSACFPNFSKIQYGPSSVSTHSVCYDERIGFQLVLLRTKLRTYQKCMYSSDYLLIVSELFYFVVVFFPPLTVLTYWIFNSWVHWILT